MKILKYILIIMGILAGIFLPIMGVSEPYLDENMHPSSSVYIPDMKIFIIQMIMGVIIGFLLGWFMWFCVYLLKKNIMKNKH